jgi:Cft2 family RNA processing exonuclease
VGLTLLDAGHILGSAYVLLEAGARCAVVRAMQSSAVAL